VYSRRYDEEDEALLLQVRAVWFAFAMSLVCWSVCAQCAACADRYEALLLQVRAVN
jgi:hypothetical protein